MSKKEMWEEFRKNGASGLKEQLVKLPDEQVASMTVLDCICKCYEMLFEK